MSFGAPARLGVRAGAMAYSTNFALTEFSEVGKPQGMITAKRALRSTFTLFDSAKSSICAVVLFLISPPKVNTLANNPLWLAAGVFFVRVKRSASPKTGTPQNL